MKGRSAPKKCKTSALAELNIAGKYKKTKKSADECTEKQENKKRSVEGDAKRLPCVKGAVTQGTEVLLL